jgi:aminoglycoside phosphotransferase (APT) family kinase protein
MEGVAEWDAEVEVGEDLARTLIAERFPQLDLTSLDRIGEGWDNTVWATADGIAFRFPRREIAVLGVRREMAVLPLLAPRLPAAIPDAAYRAAASDRFPWPWFGSRLIDGREIAVAGLDEDDRDELAADLGHFLRSLHALRLPAAAQLAIDPMGRGDMAQRVPRARDALTAVSSIWAGQTPAGRARAEVVLAEAEGLAPPAESVLVHGDLNLRHVLVSESGRLSGVIDWGDLARGPRSIDLPLYWSLFTPPARTAFRAAYGLVSEETLLRARALALFFDATLAAYAADKAMPELAHECLRGLERALID